MVFVFKIVIKELISVGYNGFSKKPIIRDPKKAPSAAPNIIESLFVFGIASFVRFLKKM